MARPPRPDQSRTRPRLERLQRQLTAPLRAMPDFVIIGAMKAGTTSLFHYLGQHPQIRPSVVKQVRFFDGGVREDGDNFRLGPLWYRSHFPLRSDLRSVGAITGEASPMTMFHPLGAERMASTVPDARLVAILRDPVDRTLSHYFHAVNKGEEDLALDAALDAEAERLAPSWRDGDYRRYSFVRHGYVARSLYARQLAPFFDRFPRDRIRIVKFEDLRDAPEATVADLAGFLGVAADASGMRFPVRNKGKPRPEVDAAVRERLEREFRAPNDALAELLGTRLY